MKRHFNWALLLTLYAITSVLALAQSVSGDLVGTIYDPTGAVVPGASVVATNVATGVASATATTSSGQYRIPNLPVGAYKVAVSASGFTRAELNNITVDLSKTVTANVTLQVGGTSSIVEIVDTSAVIDTTTSQVQTSFESRQVADLPTASSGSGILNLGLLTAGVASSGAVGAGTGPSVGGQRPRNNNFTIEGIDNNNKSITGPLVSVPNDAVAEFTILENQFSPEFGHSSGGQFNQVVKSGTNEFHGSFYEYLQNRKLNAADQLSIVNGVDPHPRFDDNRFGGTLGGPVVKNKLFFFGNYEYHTHGVSGSGGQIFAPTANGYGALAGLSGISQTNLSVLKEYLPPAAAAANPCDLPNGKNADGSCSFPVVNGRTIPLGQVPVVSPSFWNQHNAVGSVDYTISDRDSLRGRFITNVFSGLDTYANLPQFFVSYPYNNYVATLTEYHNFAPTLTNEFRLGYNRNYNVWAVGPQKFPGLDAFPNLTIDELGVNIGPDPNAPQGGVQNTYQGTDNVSWVKGRHTVKIGADFRKLIAPQYFTQRARGDYEWANLVSYLNDEVPDFAERTTGDFIYYGDQTQFGAYANDDFRVKPNLTVNLGVRYERTTIPYAERLQTVNAVSDAPGLITFGRPKVQNYNFMPRVGLAWSPGTKGNTSIRAGFGINYDQLFDNLGLLSMPPQFQQTVDVGGKAGSNFLANGGIKSNVSAGTLTQEEARAATSGYIPDQRLPKSIQWSLGVQHVFRQNYTFEARYLGSRGINLPIQDRINTQSTVTPENALPVYTTMPSQATLNSLTSTLAGLQDAFNNGGYLLPAYANAGFENLITAYMPVGNSTYHGLALQATRRFSNGLQFVGAYTWSHNIDDSTAEVFSTVTTPRRPQDFQNLRAERADSALDHRHRLTFSAVYDMPFFKGRSSWLMKNVAGNWEIAPIFTYQTGTWATVQSAVDSNLNLDSWTDRAIINPAGQANLGSGASKLMNSNGDVVAYLVNNPNARYIQAPAGTLPNGGRNTVRLRPTDNIDLNIVKRINVNERYRLELAGQFLNFLNHPQYIGGYLNDVASIGFTGADVRNFLNPASTTFNRPDMVFSSNPRTIQISAKFVF